MKICTATYHHAHNFGAMLQAYALQQSLFSLGYENEIIDYTEHKPKLFKKVTASLSKDNLVALYYNMKVLLKYKKFKSGFDRFEKFYRNKIVKTKTYYQYNELKDINCDLLLAGSDQLWNFKNKVEINKFYTFSFNHGIKKATYAISMGGYSNFNNDIKENFDKCLREFDYISAREEDVIEYLEEAGINVEHQVNIDPVFLLSKQKWTALADESDKLFEFGDYIVCYELIPNPIMKKIVDELKMKFGYKVVVVAPTAYSKMKGDYVINDAGPMELVKLIKDAKYVVSTSFHGIAFSIIFNQPFYAVFSSHAPGRIENLLRVFGFEDKGVSSLSQKLDYTFDFTKANAIIKQQRELGIKYLESLKLL
jgi:hypothetical protein